jgi:hypothetical protein
LTLNFYDYVHFVVKIGFFRKAHSIRYGFFEPSRTKSGAKVLF